MIAQIPLRDKILPVATDITAAIASTDDASVLTLPKRREIARLRSADPFKLSPEEALARGGPAVTLPQRWLRGLAYEFQSPDTYLNVLHRPLLFGGLITDRVHNGRFHTHAAGQLLITADGGLLPASYGVMDGVASLQSNLVDIDRVLDLSSIGPVVPTDGVHMLVGNAHIHFGHFLLEGLSRVWAYAALREALACDIPALVYEPYFAPYVLELLELAGIPRALVRSVPPAARFDCVFAPDVAMGTHGWITPLQNETWERIRLAALARTRFRSDALPRRIFLSRRGSARPLLNEDEVEQLAAARGYHVIVPETLSMTEKIALAANAESLAGCVGSQMYLAAFQPPGGRNVIVAPENFFLPDDLLIGHLKQHRLYVSFGSPIDRAGDQSWTCDLGRVMAKFEEAATGA